MLLKAIRAETAIPTSIPARNPSRMLFVSRDTQNPIIADKMIKPFKERLITPARSVKVSPIAASTIGAPATITPANPRSIISPDI
jgi:hypothetical protein